MSFCLLQLDVHFYFKFHLSKYSGFCVYLSLTLFPFSLFLFFIPCATWNTTQYFIRLHQFTVWIFKRRLLVTFLIKSHWYQLSIKFYSNRLSMMFLLSLHYHVLFISIIHLFWWRQCWWWSTILWHPFWHSVLQFFVQFQICWLLPPVCVWFI